PMNSASNAFVFDASLPGFEQEVLIRSREVPVLVDFWATWCGPCKTLGPILEKLAAEYNGAFLLAKVDVDHEQQLAGYFQIRSVPTVMLVKDGQIVDGFPGALPEGQLRQFLAHHGIQPRAGEQPEEEPTEAPPVDQHAEVLRLRAAVQAEPDKDELKLALAVALQRTCAAAEAERLIEALPANLAQDDRCLRARALLGFMALAKDAPPAETLQAALAANPDDHQARHLLAVQWLVAGREQEALEQLIELLRRDRHYQDGLPRKALIDAFKVVADEDLVGSYRRKMASLLF